MESESVDNRMEILGELDNTWGQYKLAEGKIGYNGLSTGYKAIFKDNKVVHIASEKYTLYPNEEAVKVADEVAIEVGAVPFDKFTGNWFVKADKHVFNTGKNDNQTHALYAINGLFDIGGGDTIHMGFAVHNSIDGSMGFSVGAYTFRNACKNMVFMGFKGKGMRFDDRESLAHIYQKHSSGLSVNPTVLKQAMLNVIQQSKGILEQYRLWKNQELKIEVARRLARKMPAKYLPEYIQVNAENKADVQLLKAPTIWDTYNDITQVIWHNDKTQYAAKKNQFDNLHKALAVIHEEE